MQHAEASIWQPLQHSQQQQSHFNGKTFDGRRAAQRKLRNNLISRCYCMNCQILELCKATAALQKSFWINLKRIWREQCKSPTRMKGHFWLGFHPNMVEENAKMHLRRPIYWRSRGASVEKCLKKKALLPELFTKQALKSVIPMSNLSNYLRSMRVIGDHRDL